MTRAKLVLVLLIAASATEALGEAPPLPWEENRPIVEVGREVYRRHSGKGVGAWVAVRYVGPGLEREEVHTTWAKSDTP